ncbi:MAG: DUF411 domain-containing protein [Longimicrobiaceae bacterium]
MTASSRHILLALLLPLLAVAASCSEADGGAPPPTSEATPIASATEITVYKTPTCGCCQKWVEHLRENGFRVAVVDRPDLTSIKTERGVPQPLRSCHTGVVDGYTIEGHVPAETIRRLLAERPNVEGIAVPGMPVGSPGMEGPNPQPYEVYTFDESGPVGLYEAR